MTASRYDRSGFTIVEILAALVVSLVIVAGVYQLLIGQNHLYMKQNAIMDVRSSLRATASLLAWEFRQASAADSDLYAIADNSVTLRSIRGSGFICDTHPSLPRVGVWGATGDFETTAVDSALVFAIGAKGLQDDSWHVWALTAKLTPSGGGVPTCDSWSGTPATDLVLAYVGSTDSLHTGAPIRMFRKTEYGLYEDGGRWWLGRKVGNAASFEKLNGPLLQPADSGLVFIYYDADGNATADRAQVAMVDIVLRGESIQRAPQATTASAFQQDSLTLRVWLRNGT